MKKKLELNFEEKNIKIDIKIDNFNERNYNKLKKFLEILIDNEEEILIEPKISEKEIQVVKKNSEFENTIKPIKQRIITKHTLTQQKEFRCPDCKQSHIMMIDDIFLISHNHSNVNLYSFAEILFTNSEILNNHKIIDLKDFYNKLQTKKSKIDVEYATKLYELINYLINYKKINNKIVKELIENNKVKTNTFYMTSDNENGFCPICEKENLLKDWEKQEGDENYCPFCGEEGLIHLEQSKSLNESKNAESISNKYICTNCSTDKTQIIY